MMRETSPLIDVIAFHIGPAPISNGVVTSWVIIIVLGLVSWLGMRRAKLDPGPVQSTLEILVEAIASQIRDVLKRDPWPFMPLIGTLFIFLVTANLIAVVPGLHPPTGHIETPAALAVIVFFSVHIMGVMSRGFGGYMRHYLDPNPFLAPLNLLSELTRTFSLMVRLFGNMMSHEILIAVVLVLAGLLAPIPFMLLGILIGVIQAYIFSILATVFVGAAIGAAKVDNKGKSENDY